MPLGISRQSEHYHFVPGVLEHTAAGLPSDTEVADLLSSPRIQAGTLVANTGYNNLDDYGQGLPTAVCPVGDGTVEVDDVWEEDGDTITQLSCGHQLSDRTARRS